MQLVYQERFLLQLVQLGIYVLIAPEYMLGFFLVYYLLHYQPLVFLQEAVGFRRWIAIFAGFLGVLVIIRPGFQEINNAAFLVIGATVAWSLSNILVKKLTATEKPMVIVFYMTCGMIPLSIPLALPHFEWLSIEQFIGLIVLSVASTVAQYCMSRSYAKSEISFLQPFDFSRLVFTAIIAFFAFNEIFEV